MKTQAFSTGYPVSGFVSGQKLSGNIRLSGIRQIAIRCTPKMCVGAPLSNYGIPLPH